MPLKLIKLRNLMEIIKHLIPIAIFCLITACGGGGGSKQPPVTDPVTSSSISSQVLFSSLSSSPLLSSSSSSNPSSSSSSSVTTSSSRSSVKTSAVSSSASSISSSSSSSAKLLIPQSLTFAQTGTLSLFVNDQLTNPAVGQGTGTITYASNNTTVASVDDKGKVSIMATGTAIISAKIAADSTYLLATASYTIEVAPTDVVMTAWIGKNNTLVNFPVEAVGLGFYRSSQLNCDIDNYLSCAFGQFNILAGTTVTDTASTSDRTGYYVLKHGDKKAELSVNKLFSARLNHQLVFFKNQLWVIAGNDRNNNYFNDIWSSTDGTIWKQQTAHAAFSARTGHKVFVFNNKL